MRLPHEIILTWSENELLKQMAYDRSQSEEFQAACKEELERERQRSLTPRQRGLEFARKLGIEPKGT